MQVLTPALLYQVHRARQINNRTHAARGNDDERKTMNKIIAIVFVAACAVSMGASAKGGSHSVHGYTTSKGTYVAPHHATNRDSTKSNNYSQKGNVNPYTGKEGTKN